MREKRELVIIPSDKIVDYENKGTSSWLEDYYNPNRYFEKVYLLSPLEERRDQKYGIEIIPVKNGSEYRRFVKLIRPDLIRSYGAYWATDFVVSNSISIPIVSSIHDTNPELIYKSIKYSDAIISMSLVLNEILKAKGVPESKIYLLGNRVDLKRFRRLNENENVKKIRKNLPSGRLILHIGRRSIQKNIDTVLKSFRHLPSDCFLVQIGQGSTDQYKPIIESLQLGNRCFWIDQVLNEDLPYWYNACDVFCVPSRWEGFGLVFIEAAACQASIITTNRRPMNDYLTDRNNAILINDPENEKEIADSIITILDNPLLSNEIRNKVRLIAENFSKEIINNKEIEIYDSVISKYKRQNYYFKALSPEFMFWKLQNKFSDKPILL